METLAFLCSSHEPFRWLGASHRAVLAFSFALAWLLVSLGRSRLGDRTDRAVRLSLAAVIGICEAIYVLFPIPEGTFGIRHSLPLQLCDLAAWVSVVALVTRLTLAQEVAVCLGLSTTLVTSLTPATAMDWPHPEFVGFFGSHALVSVATVYLILGRGEVPRAGATLRVFVVVHAYGLLLLPFNWALEANYMFMCRKPMGWSPMDWLGPWPVYVVMLDVLFALGLLGLERMFSVMRRARWE